MLPTPAKFHYIFNLRDLSRIWEGILCVDSNTITTEADVMALWKHECLRVISDRFTEKCDRDWFEKMLGKIAHDDFPEAIASTLPDAPYFVDFLRDAPEPSGDENEELEDLEPPKIYEQVSIEEMGSK